MTIAMMLFYAFIVPVMIIGVFRMRGSPTLPEGAVDIPNTGFHLIESRDGLLIERSKGIVLWGLRRALLTPTHLRYNNDTFAVMGYRLHYKRSPAGKYGVLHHLRLYAVLTDGTEKTVLSEQRSFSFDISGLREVMTRRGLLVDRTRALGTEADIPAALHAVRQRDYS